MTARIKGNVVARYSFELGSFDAFWQGSLAYTGSRSSDLNVADNAITGNIPASKFVDFSVGVKKEAYAVELFVANATDETAPLGKTSECSTGVCGFESYGIRARPRTIGIKFSQDF